MNLPPVPPGSSAAIVCFYTLWASVLSILCILIFVFLINLVPNRLPKHLRIYLTISVIGLLSMPIGNVFFCGGRVYSILLLPDPWRFINTRLVMTSGGHVARFVVLGMICERLLATVKWKSYEENQKFQKIIGYSFGFGVIIAAFLLGFSTNIANMKLSNKLIIIDAIHGITIVLALYLHWKNKRLRKKTKLCPLLSQRYQLFENIRTLSLIWPYIIMGTLLSSLAPIATNLLQRNPETYSMGIPMLYFIYNANILFAFAYFVCSVFYWRKLNKIENSKKTNLGIKMVTGRYVPKIQTPDDHFEKLRQAWD